ncbi:MAG: ribonuclease H-like domain-containing protein [Planctomycetota bacterium]|nr:ribonuclease H-like domain-containing protein [Planctomycetota bacterium]
MTGAGLLVFLVGLGYIRGNRFVVEQHFLKDPANEPAFLEAILDRWQAFGGIVTYNGRRFDRPRILDRIQFQRLNRSVPDGYHLDLFSLARRVWRGEFESLALVDLEVGLLGHVREDDMPGALCPAAYAAYLRGEEGPIRDVFRHNLEDILSLAVLLIRADRVSHSPSGPFEEAALAMGLEDAGKVSDALALYGSALRQLPSGLSTRGHRRRAAALYRRCGDFSRASEIWDELWKEGDVRSARRLAIVLEHRFGNLKRAEQIAREALRFMQNGAAWGSRALRDWEKRLARIRNKRAALRQGPARGRSR